MIPAALVVSERVWRLDGAPGGGPQPGRVWAVALIPEGGRLRLDGREVGAVVVPPGPRPIAACWSGVRRVRAVRLRPFGALPGPVALRALEPPPAPSGLARAAFDALAAARGRLGAAALARLLGCSERHLRAEMRARLGLGPAEAARLLRVEAAIEAIRATAEPLAAVAAEAGFADQAHMTRALRRHAGATPGRLRSVQVGPADAAWPPRGPLGGPSMPAPSLAEIETPDRDPVARFFAAALGWRFTPWHGPDDGLFDAGGFAVGVHGGTRPSLVAYFPVADMEAAARAVRAAGGEASGIAEAPGFGRFARCAAPGGIAFGLHQPG